MMNFKKTSPVACAFLVLNLLMVSTSFADTPSETYMETRVMQNFLNETVYLDSEPQLLDASITMNGLAMNDKCTSFVTREGTLGVNGSYVMDQLAGGEFDYLLNNNDLPNICPGYNDLLPRQKSVLWLMITTAMAHFESSCDPTQANTGAPNGTAYGLFQLHKGSEHLYGVRECVRNASLNQAASIRCALGTLDNQLRTQGRVFSSDSHWDVLRPNGAILNGRHKYEYIRNAVKNSPLCQIQRT